MKIKIRNNLKLKSYVSICLYVFTFYSSNAQTSFNKKNYIISDKVFRSEYFAGIVFRETPYADIRGTRPLPKEKIKSINHFQFDYDKQNRIIAVKYLLGDCIKSFSNRFVRAPHIKIRYEGNKEIRTFFNEHNHRMIVSGDVYEVRITRNDNGDRTSLKFYDVDNRHIENDFRIATYEWVTNNDGSIIEKRYDINGNIQRNRPGFGYFITKFNYDHKGLLRIMTNLGNNGLDITPDEAGVAHTKIGYDSNDFFVRWSNLNVNGSLQKGMSNIAEIQYTPAPLYEHSSATFIDEKGKAQTTSWGAHIVRYTHDNYGNITTMRFYGLDNLPTNVNNNVGLIKITYTSDGMYEASRKFFDKNGDPIEIKGRKIHQIKVDFDSEGRPTCKSNYNLKGDLVIDPSTGYASSKDIFDKKGRLIERLFLNKKNNLINHTILNIARIVYSYTMENTLASVKYYEASGKESKATWNPRH